MPEITLQAEKDNFGILMNFVDDFAKKMGFISSSLYRINLAAEEVIINVINHAYPQGKGHITLVCEEVTVPQRGIKLQISDNGTPFDPLAKVDPDINQAIEDRPIGGLGIHLVKKTANEIFYRRENDTNILTIVFYLDYKQD